MLGVALVLLPGPNLGLPVAVVLHEGDVGRADLGATTALDAVEQVVIPHLVQVLGPGVPVELLGQQVHRADLGAFAATDAGLRGPGGRRLPVGQGEDAVGPLGDRHLLGVQREAHHGATQHEFADLPVEPARRLDQVGDGGADADLEVAWFPDAASAQGDVAGDLRLTRDHCFRHRGEGGHVLAQDSDPGWGAVGRYFLAGEDADELFLAAAGIEGGDGADLGGVPDVAFRHRQLHGRDGLRFVVLDADQAFPHAQQVHDDACPPDDVTGALPHQHVVAGDVGLALGAVQDEGPDRLERSGIELDAGGKGAAPQPDDAGPMDALAERGGLEVRVVCEGPG